MARTVTKIPQTRNLFTTAPIATTARRRVAGYARVSTDSDEQFTSYRPCRPRRNCATPDRENT